MEPESPEHGAQQHSADLLIKTPSSQLRVTIYQLASHEIFRSQRSDGTGWHWSWAAARRDWMDATPSSFAYRCLPLTIANQIGWWVYNPVGFCATWNGEAAPKSIDLVFDADSNMWSEWITNQFGQGIVTWNTPFLFRTSPMGSRLVVCGPVNYFKRGAQALTAVIESDWMTMSFTMNWKLHEVGCPVRFDLGEPLFQVIPLVSNLVTDLETAVVDYRNIDDDAELAVRFKNWDQSRRDFQKRKTAGDVRPDDWQREYFLGIDPTDGSSVSSGHRTKLTPPPISGL